VSPSGRPDDCFAHYGRTVRIVLRDVTEPGVWRERCLHMLCPTCNAAWYIVSRRDPTQPPLNIRFLPDGAPEDGTPD